MNTNIVISLDTRRKKKDGTYPIVLRLGHNQRTTAIPTGISLFAKDWDEEKRLVKKSYTGTHSVQWLNNFFYKKRSDALDIILKLSANAQLDSLSITDLKGRLSTDGKTESFFVFAEQIVQELKTANRIGTARSYQGVVNILRSYNNGKDLSFQQITPDLLRKFETAHYSKGNTTNGLAVYLRTIRALYNKAISAGLAEQTYYPFAGYSVKTAPTEKRALEWDLLKKIINLELDEKHPCFKARNYFVASYMMYGMNFTDMAFLKKTDMVSGRIRYRRKKTSKLYDIKVTDSLMTILAYYSQRNPDSEYIFPVIKREHLLDIDKDILWARKRYNKRLKDLADLCGIEQTLTSYVSRHSFATQAMLLEIPINAISTMLGHSSLKTTQIYLKSLPTNVLDDYNRKVTQRL